MTETEWIKAILAKPDDDTVRLVMADWLIEQGQDIRARFIQIQVELARKPGHNHNNEPRPETCELCRLSFAEREFIIEGGIDTLAGFEMPQWVMDYGPPVFRRGFVEKIGASAERWIDHGDLLYTATPLREVQLTTMLPIEVIENERDDGTVWYCEAINQVSSVDNAGEAAAEMLALRWPGVKFKLPASAEDGVMMPVTNPFHTARGGHQ